MLLSILSNLDTNSIFVIDSAFSKQDYVSLNLAQSNDFLTSVDVSSSDDLGFYIQDQIELQGGKLAFGGYLEVRNIYRRSNYFNEVKSPQDERNIHLGMDIWSVAGTKVLAALDGEIHSFNNNQNHGDYGPTIILQHEIADHCFYTLYGHLSLESIVDLKVGMKFKQGECIAQLGQPEVNGDYPPHLHFQIILDMEDYHGDYPGVSSLKTLDFYKMNCPDPNLLLGLGR